MRFESVALIAFAWFAGAVWAAEPINVSLDDLRGNDFQYSGQRVRVHGMIGPCSEASCPICPSWQRISHSCYGIASWKDGAGSAAMDRLYGFTEVTVVGTVPVIDLNDPGDCFGLRGCSSGITDAIVEQLHERRSVLELPDAFRGKPVSLASEAEQLQLRAVFRTSRRTREIVDRKVPTGVFLEIEESAIPVGKSHILHASMCWETHHARKLARPSRSGDLYWNSFVNGYVCAHAEKDGEAEWVVYNPDPAFDDR